ncbi:MAG: patatin-like phospholipase family protein [candidate division NC10 bacterium]|nr:patatin-like phospholipase family protein [candidate division NC10 bacterium]
MARFAVVLGGGAARGAAHLGVLRALVESSLMPDLIVGVSIGAIVGAAYCKGEDPRDALGRLRSFSRDLQSGLANLPKWVRFKRALQLFSYETRRGFLEDVLGLRGLTFAHLKTPLLVTATCLFPLKRAVFGLKSDDSVVEAVLASTALPSRFPINVAGRPYLDGGLTGNLPTLVAARAGARVILAVSVGFLFRRREGPPFLFPWKFVDTLGKIQMRLEANVSRKSGRVVLELPIHEAEGESVLAFEKLDKLEEAGYKACLNCVPVLAGALEKSQ